MVGTFILKGYRLGYKGQEDNFAYLTIEECEGSYVPVGIYKISYFDEKALDRYEGYPYSCIKKYIPINVNGNNYLALIYVMNSFFDYHLPRKKYVNICKEGYQYFNFNPEILDNAYNVTLDNIAKKYHR